MPAIATPTSKMVATTQRKGTEKSNTASKRKVSEKSASDTNRKVSVKSTGAKKRKMTEKPTSASKTVTKKQRQMSRPNYEIVAKAKELWNKLREKKMNNDKRQAMLKELMELISGKMHEISSKHDASRIVQCVLQYGSPEQRSQVVSELREHIVELCKTTYGNFLVQKMLRYGSVKDRQVLVKAFTGHVVKLGTHNVAANILEYAQEWLKPAQFSGLKLEFYGNEFALFKSESRLKLSEIIQENSDKREMVMKNLLSSINKMVNKELLGLAFVQQLVYEYFMAATYDEKVALIPSLRDASAALLATRNGALVVAECVAYGTPKDRKRIIKALKGKCFDACNHPSGYLVLLRIMDVVDDTIMVQKTILAELIPHLFEVCLHQNGQKVILQLLSPKNKRYLNPEELACLAEPMIPSDEDKTKMVVNYKKSSETKCEELLRGLKAHLEETCEKNHADLITSKEGSNILVEVLNKWNSDSIAQAVSKTISSVVSVSEEKDKEKKSSVPIYEHPEGQFAVRRLIRNTNVKTFLWNDVKDFVGDWIKSNQGCFLLATMLANSSEEVIQSMKAALGKLTVELTTSSQNGEKGAALLLEKL